MESALKDDLYSRSSQGSEDWKDIQPKAAFDRGYIWGLNQVIGLDYEDIEDEQQRDKTD